MKPKVTIVLFTLVLFLSLFAFIEKRNVVFADSTIVLIDSYNEGNYSSGGVTNALHPSTTSKTVHGQSFTMLSSNYLLTNATFYLKTAIGSPTGTMFAKLHAHAGNYGSSSTPSGEPLATSEGISLTTLTTSYALYTFNFNASQQYEMQANQQYCISVGYVASGTLDITHSYNIGEDNSSPTHSGNSFYYLNSGFSYDASIDTIFYVYGKLVSTSNPTVDTTSNVGTATFYVNGTQYATPNSTTLATGVYNFTAAQYYYNSTATYNFSSWLINNTNTYTTRTILPNITGDTTFLLNYSMAEWSNNTSIIPGLSSTSLDSLPANPVYNLRSDDQWILVSGSYSSTFYGWYWSGSLWIPDSTLVAGLYNDTFVWTTPSIAYNLRADGKWVLISGDFYGLFHGWYWDGGWHVDQNIVTGLGDIGSYSSPSLAYNLTGDAKWTLIAGKSAGTFNGFYWDGSSWISNSTLISGLGDIGSYSMPTTGFNVRGDNTAILISGAGDGNYYGFYWNGTTWLSDITITDGLETFKLFSAPAMAFNIFGDNRWILISGREDADWKGWQNKNTIVTTTENNEPPIPQYVPQNPRLTPLPETPGPSLSLPDTSIFKDQPFPWWILFLIAIAIILASTYTKQSKMKQGRSNWNTTRQRNRNRKLDFPDKKKVKTQWKKENPWD